MQSEVMMIMLGALVLLMIMCIAVCASKSECVMGKGNVSSSSNNAINTEPSDPAPEPLETTTPAPLPSPNDENSLANNTSLFSRISARQSLNDQEKRDAYRNQLMFASRRIQGGPPSDTAMMMHAATNDDRHKEYDYTMSFDYNQVQPAQRSYV